MFFPGMYLFGVCSKASLPGDAFWSNAKRVEFFSQIDETNCWASWPWISAFAFDKPGCLEGWPQLSGYLANVSWFDKSCMFSISSNKCDSKYKLLTISKTSKAPQPPQPFWLLSAFCPILACPLLLGIRFLRQFSKATRISSQIGSKKASECCSPSLSFEFLSLSSNIGSAS